MEKRINLLKRIRLKYRRSSMLLKCVLLAAIVLSTVALLAISAATRAELAQQADLRRQGAALEHQQAELEKDTAELGTVEGVTNLGQEELGLTDPDSVIFDIE